MTPAVSIIIPAYNAGNWIVETIRSVLAQTLDHRLLEIVVVDNGSEDDTAKLVASILADTDIDAMVVSEPCRGVAHARNHGIALARGGWVQVLDADDLIHPDKLETQYRFAAGTPQNCAAAYSPWRHITSSMDVSGPDTDPVIPSIDDRDVGSRLTSLLHTNGFIPTGSQLFRRAALVAVQGYRDVGLIEDVDLYLRLVMGGWCFAYCPSDCALFLYRQHGKGLSSTSRISFYDGVVRNAALVESWARTRGDLGLDTRRAVVNCYFQAARAFAVEDWNRFDAVVERLRGLERSVIPPGPPSLALLARCIGYKSAERIASVYRGVKRVAGRSKRDGRRNR